MKFETYKVPEGQKHAGMYSFRIDGQETLFFSSEESSVHKRINWLLNGLPKGAVQLKAVKAKAAAMGPAKPASLGEINPFVLPTTKDRVAAFMSRGKLARKEEPKKEK